MRQLRLVLNPRSAAHEVSAHWSPTGSGNGDIFAWTLAGCSAANFGFSGELPGNIKLQRQTFISAANFLLSAADL